MLKYLIWYYSTFEGMKWKEQSFRNLLKQWNKEIYIFGKNVGKNSDQHTQSLMVGTNQRGREKM
jgi:hypothetical protein